MRETTIRQREPAGVVTSTSTTHGQPDSNGAVRTLVESVTTEGILVQNDAGEIVWCNGAACRVLRASFDQLIGQPWPEPRLCHEDSAESSQRHHTVGTGRPATDHLIQTDHADGTTAWLEVGSWPIVSGGEQLTVTSISDVTEALNQRTEIEQATRQINKSMFQTELPEAGRVSFASKTWNPPTTGVIRRDFCGAHQLSEQRYGFYLGDIRSSETDAPFVNSFVRHTLRSTASLLRDPHEVLYQLHNALDAEWPEAATNAVFGFIELQADHAEVFVACGGLAEPLLINESGILQYGATGAANGQRSNNRRSGPIEMFSGDRLLLTTTVRLTQHAQESRAGDRPAPLRAYQPLSEVLAVGHRLAADTQCDSEYERGTSILAIAFDEPDARSTPSH